MAYCTGHVRRVVYRWTTVLRTRQHKFEETVIPHTRSLLRVALRLTCDRERAEDLVQDTLMLAWRSFDQFHGGTNIKAWLFRILFNSFYGVEQERRASRVVLPLEPDDEDVRANDSLPDRKGVSPLDSVVVAEALSSLSLEHRSVLLLGVVEGLSCHEMAEALSIPIGTVMSRLSRARRMLRERVERPYSRLANERSFAHWLRRGIL